MALFKRLHLAGNTIVLVTHEPDVAAFANRAIYLRDGQVEKDVEGDGAGAGVLEEGDELTVRAGKADSRGNDT